MPLRFPHSSFHGGKAIDAYSLDSLPVDDGLPRDPASVRFLSIAEIMLRGIHRFVAADRELDSGSERISNTIERVSDNLGDTLPEPLAFCHLAL